MTYYEKGAFNIRDTVDTDIPALAQNLRQSDIDEIAASHALKPLEALKMSKEGSVLCYTAALGDSPVAMFGATPYSFLGLDASVWMLAGKDFGKIGRHIVKDSRRFIEVMLSFYPRLVNFVDVRNTASIRWLRYCGARFGRIVPFGVEQKLFQFFEFKRG